MKKPLILVALTFALSNLYAQKSLDIKVAETVSFSEDFTDNSKIWPEKMNDSVACKIQNGMYYHVARVVNIVAFQDPYISLFNKNNLFKYSAETTYNEGNGFFGLAFGVKDTRNFGLFLINGNADYMIINIIDAKSEILLKGKSEKINKGKNAKNILTVKNDFNLLGYQVNYLVNGSSILQLTNGEESQVPKKTLEEQLRTSNLKNDPYFNKSGSLDFANAHKIGLYTTKGASVVFDNVMLSTKPNKGKLIMMNNIWQETEAGRKYLDPIIKNEENEAILKYNAKKKRRIDSAYTSTKTEIAKLAATDKTKVVAEIDAVVWLKDVLLHISSQFMLLFEKELMNEKEGEKFYKIKHDLPNVDGPAEYREKLAREGLVNVLLGEKLEEPQARKLVNQYISNLLAANVNGAKFIDPESDDKDLHIIGISYGRDYISKCQTVAFIIPRKNDAGKWTVVLRIEYKK